MSVDMSKSHPEMDREQHEWTYNLFLRGALWLTVIASGVLVGMAIFLV